MVKWIVMSMVALALVGCESGSSPFQRQAVAKAPASGAAAVTTTSASSAAREPKLLQLGDFSLPAGSKLDDASTLVVGTDTRWLGRVVLRTTLSPVDTYNHFFRTLTGAGWNLITALQGKTSGLTFSRGERIATVMIEGSTLSGTSVTILVTPREGAN
jgi:hypothetical protein